ncbi:MAG: bifunctional UDP-N-acetylmuramoyl-tripeptide:D-alanyl-D-alanine ligase/alanine racemase [Cryomorphaceae bacterium]|nr:bifunctional UDP-N-acetylmuramoyl-tripeptide:D-alanyl-D-alanine ligase/alanine racemase [Cryomorphaceae bacterium]
MIGLKKLAEVCRAELIGKAPTDTEIIGLFTDSRSARHSDNRIFIALNGKAHKGKDYIPELYKRGFRFFMLNGEIPKGCPEATFLQVRDTLAALQLWATYHRNKFALQVVGVSGSNGKTIVKEWLGKLLENHFSVVKSPRSYNSQVGVPLSVLQLQASHNCAIFEAGISLPREMEKLEKIIQPTLGIFTNIGEAHQQNFTDLPSKAREKAKLFKNCKTVVTGEKYPEILEALKSLPNQPHLITVGQSQNAVWQWQRNGHRISLSGPEGKHTLHFPFVDGASIENGIYAVVTARILGCSWEEIDRQIEFWEPVEMRMEFVQGPGQQVIVNDAYNSDPQSLKMALEFLQSYREKSPKILIFSDFVQSDSNSSRVYSRLGKWLKQYGIDQCFAVGPKCIAHQQYFPEKTNFFQTTEELLQKLGAYSFQDATILVKGARKFALERVVFRLAVQSHRTFLEINLSAMERTMGAYRNALPKGVKIMAMVKAFSYGVGSTEIARFMEYQKVDYLAVAYIDEGIELRKAGINLPILVLNPDARGFSLMHEYQLEPEIYHKNDLVAWRDSLEKWGTEKVGIHIKLDTGMHRLGFSEDEITEIIPLLKNVQVASIMSHLAASNDPEKREFTQYQIALFTRLSGKIIQNLEEKPMRHILNSQGIQHYPQAVFDMVRLGIGLYNIEAKKENSTLKWRAYISQIRHLNKGEFIGYECAYEMPRDGTIAVISVGYADGFRRSLSDGVGVVYIHGKPCPVVGKVCMDMTMVDVSGIKCTKGDEVEIFGFHQSVSEVAKAMQTIPYEVLTGISPRVQRVYFRE